MPTRSANAQALALENDAGCCQRQTHTHFSPKRNKARKCTTGIVFFLTKTTDGGSLQKAPTAPGCPLLEGSWVQRWLVWRERRAQAEEAVGSPSPGRAAAQPARMATVMGVGGSGEGDGETQASGQI